MAQYNRHFTGSFDRLMVYVDTGILNGSVSATREGESSFTCGDVRCVTRVYERYSALGSNRLSLTVTFFGKDQDIQLSAITSGGSQAVFIKINTIGESAFMDKLITLLDRYDE